MNTATNTNDEYKTPSVTVIGSLSELTRVALKQGSIR